jgi:multidrug efflux system membrane fusion protein
MRVRFFLIILLLAAAGAGAAWYAGVWQLPASAATPPQQGRRGAFEGGKVPIVAGAVQRKDVPIWLDGLGTVQAFNMVVVRTRVDGELQKIAFTEGQDVRQGDLLAQIDPRPFQAALAQAQAKKAQDEAQLANAKRDLARYTDLRKEGNYATQQQLDTQRAQVDQLAAAIQADQAAIDTAQIQLSYSTVTAPISGRVGIRQVDQGNIVHAGDANGLVTLTQLKPISIVFTLPEANLSAVLDQSAKGPLPAVALDRDNATELARGTLAVVDNTIDQTTGTVKIKATFANDPIRLWPGQFVNMRLLLTTRKDGITVPAQVVQRGPKGAFAYVIGADEKVGVRPIKVAQIEDGEALVDEGLQPGERVVVDGQSRLQPGSQVTIRGDPPSAADGQPQRRRRGADEGGQAGQRQGRGGQPQ